jgi:hypothetical protein
MLNFICRNLPTAEQKLSIAMFGTEAKLFKVADRFKDVI